MNFEKFGASADHRPSCSHSRSSIIASSRRSSSSNGSGGTRSEDAGSEAAAGSSQWPPYLRVCLGLAQALSVLAIVLVVVWMSRFESGFGWEPSKIFNFHPVFMVIGFVVLCAEGLLVHRAARNTSRFKAKLLHASVQAAAVAAGIAGLKAVFDSRNLLQQPLPNMYSLHSWLGIACTALLCLQWAAGCVHFLLPHTQRKHRQLYLPLHRHCGIATFVLATITAITGCVQCPALLLGQKQQQQQQQHSADGTAQHLLSNFLGIVLLALCVLVVCIVQHNRFVRVDHQQLAPDEESHLREPS